MLERFRGKFWWRPLVKVLKLLLHFVSVLTVLFAGAVVFVHLEDPTARNDDLAANWSRIEARYNVSVNESLVVKLYEDLEKYIKLSNIRRAKVKDVKFSTHRLLKWLYFVTVATTTIGYGDVYPVTYFGKLFYIGFSLIGIPLMMTLLASCGVVMTAINKKIFGLIMSRCFGVCKKLASKEFLAVVAISLSLVCYVTAGVVFTTFIEENWTLVNTVYYWMVTFTTVGFGDVNISLTNQIHYLHIFILYRTFGLALVAGLIDALLSWMKVRRKDLTKNFEAKRKYVRALTSGLKL